MANDRKSPPDLVLTDLPSTFQFCFLSLSIPLLPWGFPAGDSTPELWGIWHLLNCLETNSSCFYFLAWGQPLKYSTLFPFQFLFLSSSTLLFCLFSSNYPLHQFSLEQPSTPAESNSPKTKPNGRLECSRLSSPDWGFWASKQDCHTLGWCLYIWKLFFRSNEVSLGHQKQL